MFYDVSGVFVFVGVGDVDEIGFGEYVSSDFLV